MNTTRSEVFELSLEGPITLADLRWLVGRADAVGVLDESVVTIKEYKDSSHPTDFDPQRLIIKGMIGIKKREPNC